MSVVYLLPAPRVGQEKKVWSVNLEPTKTAEGEFRHLNRCVRFMY